MSMSCRASASGSIGMSEMSPSTWKEWSLRRRLGPELVLEALEIGIVAVDAVELAPELTGAEAIADRQRHAHLGETSFAIVEIGGVIERDAQLFSGAVEVVIEGGHF